MLNCFYLTFLAFQPKLDVSEQFSVRDGQKNPPKMKAEVLQSHLTWEKELVGKLAKSRSKSGVIKNFCISYYHNKTVSR